MGTPTQLTYVESSAGADGYIGASAMPAATRKVFTAQQTGIVRRGAWASLTAYAVGDMVTYGTTAYVALAVVAASNTTPPAAGATWGDLANHKGPLEIQSPTTRKIQPYR